MADLIYRYDGSFDGFLCCVFESYAMREAPIAILAESETQGVLFREKWIPTEEDRAGRVFRSMAAKISPSASELVQLGFLTCLPEREMLLYRFLQLGYRLGANVTDRLTDDTVCALHRAVKHLNNEAHRFKQFVRFSDFEGVLTAVIDPKNNVLPLLQEHFCTRYSAETLFLYDRTHRLALFYHNGRAGLYPVESFTPSAPGQQEREYRALWRRYYDNAGVEGRENPRCRMTHMPKWYWKNMTEFQREESLLMEQSGDTVLPEKQERVLSLNEKHRPGAIFKAPATNICDPGYGIVPPLPHAPKK
jgi:probable DNA metabolism protein